MMIRVTYEIKEMKGKSSKEIKAMAAELVKMVNQSKKCPEIIYQPFNRLSA